MSATVFTNGKFYVERGVFAQAVYAEDGVIKAVGTEAEVRSIAKAGADAVDCGGRTVIPGINDSHCHLMYVGVEMSVLRLSGAKSIDDIIERGRRYLAEHPEAAKRGIEGMGWNDDLFTEGEKRLLTRHDLDKISRDIPIIVSRACGHVGTVNTKVIEMLGLGKDSPQLEYGVYERDEDGYPNGIFKENVSLATALLPKYLAEEYGEMYVKAAEYAVSCGVTSVQSNDAGAIIPLPVEDVIGIVNDLTAKGRAKIRHRFQVTFSDTEEFRKYIDGAYAKRDSLDERVALGPLKLFRDGSLGGRTATMRQDYRDDAGNTGVEMMDDALMDEFCRVARDAGIQVFTHAIGDRAVADTVGCYIRADAQNRLRNTVNHCQITDRALLEQMAANNICVAYQPIFLDYDMHITESRVGRDLASTSYAFGTMAKLGAHVGYGTDSPVENINPFPCICCAVTRTDKNGFPEGGWFPEEKVDVETAIDAYTAGSAYIEFREADKGRIKPGFLADMTVLDTDIFTCDPLEIRNIRPTMTIIGGEIAYSLIKN